MNAWLIFVGAVILVVCVGSIIKIIYENNDADVVMIRSVLLVIGVLLAVALLLEGLSADRWTVWLPTFDL